MRTCRTCGKTQPMTEFYAPSYRCKSCRREYANARFAERAEFLRKVKSNPCADCKKRYPPYCMDFDHREDKVSNLSKMMTYKMERILAEIAKCDLVCANCHRKRTHERIGELAER